MAPSSSSTSNSAAKPVYGLGLDTSIDLLSSGDASVAKISLQNVMSQITNVYQKLNTPASTSTTPTSAQSNAPAPAYLQAQVANYSLALQSFNLANSLSSTSSTSSTSIGLSSSLMQSLLAV